MSSPSPKLVIHTSFIFQVPYNELNTIYALCFETLKMVVAHAWSLPLMFQYA
jgi:hypothetical protein